MFLAVDPGIDTGWAAFENCGELIRCGVGDPPFSGYPLADIVVMEKPRVYSARNSKGDPNGLIILAMQLGRYWERAEKSGLKSVFVFPQTWKGTVPKDIHNARVYGALTPQEQTIVGKCGTGLAKGKIHNMIDAVGLGKWAYEKDVVKRARDGLTG